jgi:hypothetical protein
MGKDTKYLTVALIVLCAIAALIVLFYPKNSRMKGDENIHAETDIERRNSSDTYPESTKKTTELYADNSSTETDPVKTAESYRDAFGDKKVATVDDVPTKPVVTPKTTVVADVPAAYEENSKPKKALDKLTEKGGAAIKPVAKKEDKIGTDKLSGFLVVTNQFGSKDNALKEVDKLKAKGYTNSNVVSLDNKVFMSYAGRMDKREDAVKLLNQLKAKGFKPIIKDLN